MAATVSVIIVDYNAGPLLRACLNAVMAQDYPRVETIVVDNASRDGSADGIPIERPSVRLIRSAKNLGFAGGTNLGVRESHGEIVLFLNPDTEAAPDLCSVVASRLLADKTIGVLGAKIYNPGWKIIQHAGGTLRDNALTDHVGRGDEDVGQHDAPRECAYVTGAAFAVRRAVLDEVGLLDSHYQPAYFEETDLCFRVRRKGYRIVYEPSARLVHHEGTASGGTASERFFYNYHKNRIRFVLRQYSFLGIVKRFVPAEISWMRAFMPQDQKAPLARAYAVNALRLPLTLLGY